MRCGLLRPMFPRNGVSVVLSVVQKTAERIDVLSDARTPGGPRHTVSVGGPDLPREKGDSMRPPLNYFSACYLHADFPIGPTLILASSEAGSADGRPTDRRTVVERRKRWAWTNICHGCRRQSLTTIGSGRFRQPVVAFCSPSHLQRPAINILAVLLRFFCSPTNCSRR